MGLFFSLLLAAVGAILRYAVVVQTQGFNLQTIGLILLIVGIIGAVLSVIFWGNWGVRRRTVSQTSMPGTTQGMVANGGRTETVQEERGRVI